MGQATNFKFEYFSNVSKYAKIYSTHPKTLKFLSPYDTYFEINSNSKVQIDSIVTCFTDTEEKILVTIVENNI